jgi:hypothetical protein
MGDAVADQGDHFARPEDGDGLLGRKRGQEQDQAENGNKDSFHRFLFYKFNENSPAVDYTILAKWYNIRLCGRARGQNQKNYV